MVSNRGQLVLPATMRITFKDGTTNNVIIPVETWIQSASHTFAVDDRRPIASVVIDPIAAFRSATALTLFGRLPDPRVYLCD